MRIVSAKVAHIMSKCCNVSGHVSGKALEMSLKLFARKSKKIQKCAAGCWIVPNNLMVVYLCLYHCPWHLPLASAAKETKARLPCKFSPIAAYALPQHVMRRKDVIFGDKQSPLNTWMISF